MKGDVSPIIYILVAVVIAIAIITMFLTSGGRFTSKVSKADCQTAIIDACRKYMLDPSASREIFKDIPKGCGTYYPDLKDCATVGGTPCDTLCSRLGI